MFSLGTFVVGEKMLSMLLLLVLSNCVPVPLGVFRTECQDRHFLLAVKSHFLGQMFRFDIGDTSDTVRTVSGQWAAECGYTVMLDSRGDLVLRASYLACNVENPNDLTFQLLVQFVNTGLNGKDTMYPFLLTCVLQQPWSPREIVCEENYMEVSVKNSPPATHTGLEWMAPATVRPDEGPLMEWWVTFRVPGLGQTEEALPLSEARLLGYHINTMGSRILLRSTYSSPLSYALQVGGVDVEAVSATIFYRHQWTLLRVDASVACTLDKGTMEGVHILWTIPQLFYPLVQAPLNWGYRMGVEGWLLSDYVLKKRGYEISVRDDVVVVRIPFGAKGGFIKSHIVDGQYSQSYSIDLFYLHQWEDGNWALTQHRSYRSLSILPTPRTPTLNNITEPSEGVLSATLGVFPPDVSLHDATVVGCLSSWEEAERLGLRISYVPFPNGTHAYWLQAPFSHPLVSQKYIGRRYRRYMLEVNVTLRISPGAELYTYPASVVWDRQDVVLPSLEGWCTDGGVEVLVRYGNLYSQWEIYFGAYRLDWELVDQGGYELETYRDFFTLQVPLYSLGITYEDLSLRGLVVSVVVSVLDMDTAEVEDKFVQSCTFPFKELVVCLPNKWMVALVDMTNVVPPVDPRQTALLDPTCRPSETDGTRALFSFSLESCGTVRGEDHLYVNEIRYSPKVPHAPDLVINPHYRLPVACHYPMNGSWVLGLYEYRAPAKFCPLKPPHSRTRRSSATQSQQHSIRGRKTGQFELLRLDLQKERSPTLGWLRRG